MIKLYSNIRQLLQLLILIFLFSSLSTLAQDSKLSENNLVSKSKLETNDFEYGLTIINHGAQFFGFTPFDWMIEMAEAINRQVFLKNC